MTGRKDGHWIILTKGSILAAKSLFQERNFMSGKDFLDTNALIYAYDSDAGEKHTVAAAILRNHWETETGIVSVQVLQEFYVNLTRKIPNPLPKPKAMEIIQSYRAWPIELNDIETIFAASEFE
jgi:predicted nucleic acid-binding protein